MNHDQLQALIMRYHREMSHQVLKQASQKASFKQRLISHLGQMQYLAPLLTSITLHQFRGLVEADKDLYAFKDRLPDPSNALWVQLTTVEIGEGDVDLYYNLTLVQTRFNPIDYLKLRFNYERLHRWQQLINDTTTHPITLVMVEAQLRRFDPLQ